CNDFLHTKVSLILDRSSFSLGRLEKATFPSITIAPEVTKPNDSIRSGSSKELISPNCIFGKSLRMFCTRSFAASQLLHTGTPEITTSIFIFNVTLLLIFIIYIHDFFLHLLHV